MMSRTLRILLAGTVAVVLGSAVLASPAAAADEPGSSEQSQVVIDNKQVDPEHARRGGGAAPFETGVVIVLNTLLLGGLLGGILWGRQRLGRGDTALPRLSV